MSTPCFTEVSKQLIKTLQVGENTPKEKQKISRAQRDIEEEKKEESKDESSWWPDHPAELNVCVCACLHAEAEVFAFCQCPRIGWGRQVLASVFCDFCPIF